MAGIDHWNSWGDVVEALDLTPLRCCYLPHLHLCSCIPPVLYRRQGVRYGLVGRNGSGKSTLLRAIAGGRVVGFPRGISVGYVHQEAVGDERSSLQTLLDTDQV